MKRIVYFLLSLSISLPAVAKQEPYLPPVPSRPMLQPILEGAAPVRQRFTGDTTTTAKIFKLRTGQVYIESDMDIDADGSPRALEIDPGPGQLETSLTYEDDRPVNSERVPYFVLPSGFFQKFNIRLGDIGAVIYRGKVTYAVFADVGPSDLTGEGSLALHEALGHNPWEDSSRSRILNESIPDGVVYVVFPGSGDGTPQTPARISAVGAKLWKTLLRDSSPMIGVRAESGAAMIAR
jgi:Fungal chitosanase of glycosyl hydrolase group 75